MSFNPSISSSENALVINLDQARIEEIVEKKLLCFLSRRPLGRNILKIFYEPPEQALVELILEKWKGNQFQAAKALGINRNTLKKKILAYNVNIKELLTRSNGLNYPQSRIFLSSVESLNLLSACRAKLAFANAQKQIPKENVLKQIGRPVEIKIIQKVLEYCGGNQIRASRFLGINRSTLKKKMNFHLRARVG